MQHIWKGRFARNVAVATAGTVGAQVISMAFAPLITRLYGPEAFGLLGMFVAMVAVAAPIAALAYPIAIVLPRDDRDAVGLVRLSVCLSLAIAAVAGLALWIGRDGIASLLGVESISDYVLLIPIAMLFSAWLQIAQQWRFRRKEFSITARVAVVQSLIVNGAKTGVGFVYPLASVLILLTIVGHALHVAMLTISRRSGYRGDWAGHERPVRSASLGELARRFSDFPIYRAPQNLINAVSHSIPLLMLAAFFGPAVAGFYALARMVMGMPSVLVGKSVGDVFYPRITEASRSRENLSSLILKATGVLAVLGLVPFGVVVVFGPWLFGFIFGADWVHAGEYARWLALFYFLNFINKPSVAAVPALGIQRGLLIYEIFSTAGKVSGVFVGFYVYSSDIVAVALFSLFGAVAYIFMIAWIIWTAGAGANHGQAS